MVNQWIKRLISSVFLLLVVTQSHAITSLSFSSGYGKPNDAAGGRVAAQWAWPKVWGQGHMISLTGYWDLSLAHWRNNGDPYGNHKSLTNFAFGPVFRLQFNARPDARVIAYLEASAVPSVHTAKRFGRRNMGSLFAFSDLLGIGAAFGSRHQHEISYHYLHYSNANLFPPNNGIDIKVLITYTYHIA